MNFLLPNRRDFFPKPILNKFWFSGNIDLIKQLATDKSFCEKIIHERIYIETGFKSGNQIVLTPKYGIKDIKQFEKYVSILQSIENKIKTTHNKV